ncbi:MAG: hypothetical protein M9923_08495 [Phycicoccus sp.]|uniref:hypothetical protein n=1 Tax=Phycicoccus sp. TaxID=1902410 RepID=UPI00258781AC|nr:hypothetical protein [Phycicoccus sp.]MCO5303240.1 hypothetical protein [Phycicoccus sp.]
MTWPQSPLTASVTSRASAPPVPMATELADATGVEGLLRAVSCAAAAVVALPTVRGVGSPRSAAATQTSPKALAYAAAPGERPATSSESTGVGPDRHRRPREAAAMKSSAPRSPPVMRTQSTCAPGAASATVAASASPSARTLASSTP